MVDFAINIRRLSPTVKVIGATVEIKPYYPGFPVPTIGAMKVNVQVANIFRSMLPQTIQQVQFVFDEFGMLDEVWAIQLVPPLLSVS